MRLLYVSLQETGSMLQEKMGESLQTFCGFFIV